MPFIQRGHPAPLMVHRSDIRYKVRVGWLLDSSEFRDFPAGWKRVLSLQPVRR